MRKTIGATVLALVVSGGFAACGPAADTCTGSQCEVEFEDDDDDSDDSDHKKKKKSKKSKSKKRK